MAVNSLTLSGGDLDQKVTFTKSGTNQVTEPAVTQTNETKSGDSKLIGVWSGNGTNSQGADRGTWYVQGDRIYHNSQTRGQGSYQLQKLNHPKNRDPMIVLDGEAYVTYYQKPPW